jgi:hypothetical protein
MAKKPFNVRYSDDEMRRIEQATARAGYEHVSTWVRDKSLDRIGAGESGINSLDTWVDRQELMGRLLEIERSQKGTHVLLAMLLFLVRKKSTTGEVDELLLACENVGAPVDVLAAFLPDLAALLTPVSESP